MRYRGKWLQKMVATILLLVGLCTLLWSSSPPLTVFACTNCISFTTVPTAALKLNGYNQTVSSTLVLNLNNISNLTGWNLTITSTQYTNGVHRLPKTASSITNVIAACSSGQTCVSMPQNTISYPLAIPADNPAPTAVEFYNAQSTTGIGTFDISVTINLTIAATTYNGAYSSALTVSFVSGP